MFIEIPATEISIARRKPLYGSGINDAGYMIRLKPETCPYYDRWSNMIKRCYSKKFHVKNLTYMGCSVCKEWLTFSKFKSWMQQQIWEGLVLDKDIINPGNKIYSPENCCFISGPLNLLLCDAGAIRGEHPQGVYWDKSRKKYSAFVCCGGGKRKSLGRHITSESASLAYIKAKTEIILKEAARHQDPRVVAGLILHAKLLAQ